MNRANLSKTVLMWYDQYHRKLPWRYIHNETPNPYYVWLSEVMLQQTQVDTVIPYFNAFIQRWPTIQDLAGTEIDEVLHAWQGLGYYSRARNLHACAQQIVKLGKFPNSQAELQNLPGIGPYTSAAISAIAFNEPSVVVDGNIARIVSRVFGLKKPIKLNAKTIHRAAEQLTPVDRPGDYAQALMDIGAGICRPKQPNCQQCPLLSGCVAGNTLEPEQFPGKAAKKTIPTRYAVAWVCRQKRQILLRQRQYHKMLNRLWELPGSNWEEDSLPELPEVSGEYRDIKHTFSHFHLITRVALVPTIESEYLLGQETWIDLDRLGEIALSTLTKKLIQVLPL